jgi:8-oxo-dGTP diphosphatase
MRENSEVPRVGVGCIVMRNGKMLLVRNHAGFWSTPGGHLDFGESPADCAARETAEEAGLEVTNLEFVAVTNDVFEERGKHYVTIWMRGESDHGETVIGDTAEISEVGWFDPDALPKPRHLYFENLMSGRCLPSPPPNLPFTIKDGTSSVTGATSEA